jgi:hypothetical protein
MLWQMSKTTKATTLAANAAQKSAEAAVKTIALTERMIMDKRDNGYCI